MSPAHLDTVFPPETPLPVKREGTKIYAPGIGDDTRGLAEILTLARAIKESGLKPVGDIIIGGNVGEEGLGDLRGMRHFFSKNADKVDGFISVDGAGCLICHGGTGSHRYEVTFRGPGTFLLAPSVLSTRSLPWAAPSPISLSSAPERTEDYLLRRCRKRRNLHQCHRI
ncbi:MAG: M20/M25/M40 family metallo-hydrolase [Roseburia sp.]